MEGKGVLVALYFVARNVSGGESPTGAMEEASSLLLRILLHPCCCLGLNRE